MPPPLELPAAEPLGWLDVLPMPLAALGLFAEPVVPELLPMELLPLEPLLDRSMELPLEPLLELPIDPLLLEVDPPGVAVLP